jgi:ferredoxin-NADP reductase
LQAGGTGITPFIPFLQKEINNPSEEKTSLVYGVKRPAVLIVDDVITKALSNLNGFRLYAFCEERANSVFQFPMKQGRLTMDALLQTTTDPTKAVFYLSGPVEMINTFKNGHKDTGINDTKIHIDEWE